MIYKAVNTYIAQIENFDTQFNNKSQRYFNETEQTVKTPLSVVHTREIQTADTVSTECIPTINIPEAYRVDAKPYVERNFYLEDVEWNTTHDRYSILNSQYHELPGSVLTSNPSLENAMRMASLYRSNLILNISAGGTINHAGCLLIGIMPPIPGDFNSLSHMSLINTLLSGPHAFLFANEATSFVVPVPWYCNTDLATLDIKPVSQGTKTSLDVTARNGNYATLVIMTLNPLRTTDSSSQAVRVVISAQFKHLDMLVPTPRYVEWVPQSLQGAVSGLLDMGTTYVKKVTGDAIDSARGYLRAWTGLHNPNNAGIKHRIIATERNFPNMVDGEQFFEKLDPLITFNRIVKEPIFHTTKDEQLLNHILSKQQMLGTFKISVDNKTGDLLWCRPISPYQGGLDPIVPVISNNIEAFHLLSRAWSGDLNIHLTGVMNNKQQFKLMVAKMYNPSIQALSNYPSFRSVFNAPTNMLEFSQGGQTHTVELPYICRNKLTPCSREPNYEAFFHGMYYIYLAQPLVIADGSPKEVEVNVFMSASPNFNFYGYATERGSVVGFDDFIPFEEEDRIALSEFRYENTPVQIEGKTKYIKTVDFIVPSSDLTPNGISSMFGISVKNILYCNEDLEADTILEEGLKLKLALDMNEKDLEIAFKVITEANEKDAKTLTRKLEYQKYIKDRVSMLPQSRRVWNNTHKQNASETENDSVNSQSITQSWERLDYLNKNKKKKRQYTWLIQCAGLSCGGCKVEKKRMTPQSLEVMNAPQHQESNMTEQQVDDIQEHYRLAPNIDIRNYIRRMYLLGNSTLEIEPGQGYTVTTPLAAILGEDPFLRYSSSSPISIISNMFYGKTAGFKIKIRISVLKGPSDRFSVSHRFLPPNHYFTAASGTALGCYANLTADAVPGDSPYGQYPLPYQVTPATGNETVGTQMYEYIIPDVTFYKFMGSPAKLATSSYPTLPLSTFDFGTILLRINNYGSEPAVYGVEIFAGLSDESRFGFQCIAPKIEIPITPQGLINTLYGGNINSQTGVPLGIRNQFVYKGGFLT